MWSSIHLSIAIRYFKNTCITHFKKKFGAALKILSACSVHWNICHGLSSKLQSHVCLFKKSVSLIFFTFIDLESYSGLILELELQQSSISYSSGFVDIFTGQIHSEKMIIKSVAYPGFWRCVCALVFVCVLIMKSVAYPGFWRCVCTFCFVCVLGGVGGGGGRGNFPTSPQRKKVMRSVRTSSYTTANSINNISY